MPTSASIRHPGETNEMVKMIQLAPIPQVKGPEWGRKSRSQREG
jgi:hypothetical protein